MKSCCVTDVGQKRMMNQDFVYASEEPVGNLPNLFVVADGMGGHNAGEFASRLLVEELVKYLKKQKTRMPEVKALKEGIQAANQLLYQKAAEDIYLSGMGTTLVAAFYAGDALQKELSVRKRNGKRPVSCLRTNAQKTGPATDLYGERTRSCQGTGRFIS